MIAWVSPSLMVRSTPLRISLGPSSGVDRDVQVLDLQRCHVSFLRVGASMSMSTSSPSICTGKTGTGSVAGGPVGLPVRRSKREPCSQHSMVQSSTSPSESATAAWLHSSSMAKTSSSWRTTATSSPSTSTPSGALSVELGERAGSLEAHPVIRPDVLLQLGLDGGDQLLLELGHADLADQVVEEAVHDQAAGLGLLDPARAQVEQLVVVEPTGRRGVAGALDLAGLDLEVGHRVGLAAVGEHEVAVLLVGLDALGDLADQHVADPDGVRTLALQRALVDDVAAGVRLVVVDEEPVLDVLALVGEVHPEHLDRAARAGVLRGGVVADDVAAEGDGDVAQGRVATDLGVLGGVVHGVVVPVLHGDDGELGTVADDDLDVLGQRRGALEAQHDGGPGERAGPDDEVAGGGDLVAGAGQRDRGRLLADVLLGHVDQEHARRGLPGTRADPVGRHDAGGAAGLVVDADGLGGDAGRGVHLDRERVAVERRVLVEVAQPLERREPPDLLAPGGHEVVGDVERPLGVQVRRHPRGCSSASRTDSVTVTVSLLRTSRRELGDAGNRRRPHAGRPPGEERADARGHEREALSRQRLPFGAR